MSCPDWNRLLEDRERRDHDVPEGWAGAIDHLGGCGACRVEAVRLDPTLVFHAQPALEVTDDDVAEIVANVRTLRRAREAEQAADEPRRRLGRFAAAAAVVSLMILLPTYTQLPSGRQAPVAGPALALERTGSIAPRSFMGDGPAPVIEPLDLPLARIYQLGEEDLSVVMVVDESLDV